MSLQNKTKSFLPKVIAVNEADKKAADMFNHLFDEEEKRKAAHFEDQLLF
ncbi:hypothetical protein [Ectobacillus funiculus]|nr:hypothetical protein [Ectobacillus funiculus]